MSETTTFKLPGSLVHATGRALLDEFKSRTGSSLLVDASEVDFLGGQCLQVLIAASRKWADEGKDFTIINESVAFSEGLTRLGMDASELSVEESAQ